MNMTDLIPALAVVSIVAYGLLLMHARAIDKQAKRIETLEQELAIMARGYFLRDDRPIREGGGFEGREEAYSLFQKSPYERLHVFGGPKSWAVNEAHKHVFGKAE